MPELRFQSLTSSPVSAAAGCGKFFVEFDSLLPRAADQNVQEGLSHFVPNKAVLNALSDRVGHTGMRSILACCLAGRAGVLLHSTP
jgi:hypothetical protein